jgi:hypothetical protein
MWKTLVFTIFRAAAETFRTAAASNISSNTVTALIELSGPLRKPRTCGFPEPLTGFPSLYHSLL